MPQSIPSEAGAKARLAGIFHCPLCRCRWRETLKLSPEEVGRLLRCSSEDLGRQHLSCRCPRCSRRMWMEKVVDASGRVIFDTHRLLLREVERLRRGAGK